MIKNREKFCVITFCLFFCPSANSFYKNHSKYVIQGKIKTSSIKNSDCTPIAPFQKLFPNSKFMYHPTKKCDHNWRYNEIESTCKIGGLWPAVVTSMEDLKSAAMITDKEEQVWGMSIKRVKKEWLEVIGTQPKDPIKFSAFLHEEPDQVRSCVGIIKRRYSDGVSLHWKSFNCKIRQLLCALCQWPKGTVCYNTSDEESQKFKEDKLIEIGLFENMKIHVGTQQKTHDAAVNFCESNGCSLLNVDHGSTDIGKIIGKWRRDNGFFPELSFYAHSDGGSNKCKSFYANAYRNDQVTEAKSKFRPCSLPLHFLCQGENKDPDPDPEPEPDCGERTRNGLVPFNAKSKFLYLDKDDCSTTSYDKVVEICAKDKLVPLALGHLSDHRSFEKHVVQIPNVANKHWAMDIRLASSSNWMYRNRQNIMFSWFAIWAPLKTNTSKCSAVGIYPYKEGLSAFWRNQDCQSSEMPLCIACQYPDDSKCFAESEEERNKDEKDELVNIGEVNHRMIYIGSVQKDHLSAVKSCQDKNMDLLNFDQTRQELIKILVAWRRKRGFNPECSFYAKSVRVFDDKCPSFGFRDNQTAIAKVTSTRACSLPLYYVCESKRKDFDCGEKVGGFTPIRKMSKYLFLENDKCDGTSYSQIATACGQEDLVPISITSLQDQMHLNNWMQTKPVPRFWAMDLHLSTSDWVDSSNKRIIFSWFAEWAPKNTKSDKCGLVETYNYNEGDSAVGISSLWRNFNCDISAKHLCTVCQYPQTSKCYASSDEEKEKERNDKLDMIGSVGYTKVYVGSLQKNYQDALKSCEENNLDLLNIDRIPQNLAGIITRWRKYKGMNPDMVFYGKSVTVYDNACQSYYVEKTHQASILKASGTRHCSLPLFYFCGSKHTDFTCGEKVDNFIPVNPNSKYLYMENDKCSANSYAKVVSNCGMSGLLPMSFKSLSDHQSFEKYTRANGDDTSTWTMDIHLSSSLDWKDSNNRNIQFSMFDESNPEDKDNLKCGYIKRIGSQHGLSTYWGNYDCNAYASILCTGCQYSESSKCFTDSQEEKNKETRDDIDEIGTAAFSKIYVGTIQKPYDEAVKSCKTKNLAILSLDRNQGKLIKIIKKWSELKGLSEKVVFYAASTTVYDNMCPSYFIDDNKPRFKKSTGKKPCSLPMFYFCQSLHEDFECGKNTEHFEPIRPTSKYLFLRDNTCSGRSYADVASKCGMDGLIPISFTSLQDHQSFEKWVIQRREKLYWPTDIHLSPTADWRDSNNKNIQFSWFAIWEPTSNDNHKCVYITHFDYSSGGGATRWGNDNCDKYDRIICTACQYPEASKCFTGSEEELKKDKKDNVELIGSLGMLDIFAGTLQKNHEDAINSCKKNKLTLINVDIEPVIFSKIIHQWREKKGLSEDLTFYGKSVTVFDTSCQSYYADSKGIHKTSGKRPCSLPLYYFCHGGSLEFDCDKDTNNFARIRPKSKYLSLKDDQCIGRSYSDVVKNCAIDKLIPASFKGMGDHKSFEKWVKMQRNKHMWTMDIHLSSLDWTDSSNKLIEFSWFATDAPKNEDSHKCGYVKYMDYQEGRATVWGSTDCDKYPSHICTICQYPESSKCFTDSTEEAEKERRDVVEQIQSFGIAKVFVGSIQKNHADAIKSCEANDLTLVNLDLDQLHLAKTLNEWRSMKGLSEELSFYGKSQTVFDTSCPSYFLDKTSIKRTEGKRPCSLPLHFFCQSKQLEYNCGQQIGDLLPIKPASKYLASINHLCSATKTYEDVAQLCGSLGLKTITYNSLKDQQSIQQWIQPQPNRNDMTFPIDVHLSSTLDWTDSNNKITQTSWFAAWAPLKDDNHKCAYVRHYEYPWGPATYWGNANCNAFKPEVCTLCQYPEYSKCFTSSEEESTKETRDILEHIGSYGLATLHAGTLQKNYADAMQKCKENGFDHINLDRMPQYYVKVIDEWRIKKGIISEISFYGKSLTVVDNECPSYYIDGVTFKQTYGKRPCSLPLFYFCEGKEPDFDCGKPTGSFIPIGPKSKYLTLNGDSCDKKSYSEYASACGRDYLVPMSLKSLSDHQSFENWARTLNVKDDKEAWPIDAHLSDSKDWVDSNNKAIVFNWFAVHSPFSKNGINCAYIGYWPSYREGTGTYWSNQYCDNMASKVCTVCQYPETSKCFVGSDEEMNKETRDDVEEIGKFGLTHIYAGTIQKNHAEAIKSCEKNGLELLNLDKKSNLFIEIIEQWRQSKKLSVELSFYGKSQTVFDAACPSYFIHQDSRKTIEKINAERPCSLTLFYFCQKKDVDFDCGKKTGHFVPIGSNSKYLFLDGDSCNGKTTYAEVAKSCGNDDLVPVTFKSMSDHKSFEEWLKIQPESNELTFPIDVHLSSSNDWIYSNDKIIEFSWFAEWAPHAGDNKCGYVRTWDYAGEGKHTFWGNVHCNGFEKKVCTACQYPEYSKCFTNSDEENKKEKEDTVKEIATFGVMKIYTGTLQKNYNDAIKSCEANGLKLLNLDLDPKHLAGIITNWRKSSGFSDELSFYAKSVTIMDNACPSYAADISKGIYKARGHRPCSLVLNYFCQSPQSEFRCGDKIGNFIPITTHSKYLSLIGDTCSAKSYGEVAGHCGSVGLIPMAFKSMSDYHYFNVWFQSHVDKKLLSWPIDAHLSASSDWVYSNSKNIDFSIFAHWTPDNNGNNKCALVTRSKGNDVQIHSFWSNEDCDNYSKKVCTACQYPEYSKCFTSSIEEKSKETKDTLDFIGTAKQYIYVGSLQKPYKDAVKMCEDKGLTLLNVDQDSKLLVDVISAWRTTKGLAFEIDFYARSATVLDNACPSYYFEISPPHAAKRSQGHRPCSLPLFYFCQSNYRNFKCGDKVDNLFVPLSSTSKYLYLERDSCSKKSYSEVAAACGASGLLTMSINSLKDHQYFEKYAINHENKLTRNYTLDVHESTNGDWVDANDQKVIFQWFAESAPVADGNYKCVYITYRKTNNVQGDEQFIYWGNQPCDNFHGGLCTTCMYPKVSPCFINSDEERDKERRDELIQIRDEEPKMFVGTLQKSHAEAEKHCNASGLHLLEIERNSANQAKVIDSWRMQEGINIELTFYARTFGTGCESFFLEKRKTHKRIFKTDGNKPCSLPMYFICQNDYAPWP